MTKTQFTPVLPKQICGYPIPGWMLDHVQFDERKGQPDGWIVSLKRNGDSWMRNLRSTVVMARSDIGPLEAWDEALQIALREDAREAERKARGEQSPLEELNELVEQKGLGLIRLPMLRTEPLYGVSAIRWVSGAGRIA